MFALLTVLWCKALAGNKAPATERKKIFTVIAAVWAVYGIIMEFVQRYCIPNRSFDLWDILADALGCAAGLYLCMRYIKK